MSKQPNQRQRERAFRSSMRRLVSPDAHRWAMPVIALVMLIGIIAGAIWVSSITRQHVHLDDGTVWVTSLKNRKAARFNVKLKEPDSAVASSAARFDIVQHDSDTVLTEGAKATGISSATLGTTGRTETKGDTTAVTGGGTIAFLNTKNGNVWVGRSSDRPCGWAPEARSRSPMTAPCTDTGPPTVPCSRCRIRQARPCRVAPSPKGRPYPPTISPWWTAPRSSHPRADCTGTRAAPTPAPTAR